MNEEIQERIKRIYAALGGMSEDWTRQALRVTPTFDAKSIGVMLDFKGGTTDEEISNQVHITVHNIANLRDHLRKWARENQRDESKVDDAFRSSEAIRLIADLSNNDKHGYPPRAGGFSGCSPRLMNVTRALQTKGPGSSFRFSLRDGSVTTAGNLKVVIDADIVAADGEHLGSLPGVAADAITDWERLLQELGISR
jgi:hypothetical protein